MAKIFEISTDQLIGREKENSEENLQEKDKDSAEIKTVVQSEPEEKEQTLLCFLKTY